MVVAALAVLGLVRAASQDSDTPRTAPTPAAVRSTLAALGAAVLHDRPADFLTHVSQAKASATFRTAREQSLDNLQQLPLGSWQYTAAGRTDDAEAEQTATRRYGQPAAIYHVVLRYGLSGYDPTPTSRDLYWSFVQGPGGSALLAGDDDLAEFGGSSWRGPWDFGRITVGRGTSVLVIAHAAAGNLSTLVTMVDAAVPDVTKVWGTSWPQRVVVLVPDSADELRADAGLGTELTTDSPAATVSDGSDPLTRAAYGLRLVVNPPALAKLTEVGARVVLRHEITHIAAAAATTDASPTWVVEGLAEYVGQLASGQSPPVYAQELATQVRAGTLPAALPVDSAFDTDATAASAYEQSWLACRLIAQLSGQAGLVRFYREVGGSYNGLAAVSDALGSVLHLTLPQFTAQWRAYLGAQLG